ncbi:hypothetical protein RI367_005328 [Sorochytrium milnesiophthora]
MAAAPSYVGCYQSQALLQVINQGSGQNLNMSPAWCAATCAANALTLQRTSSSPVSFPVFAISRGENCVCGTNLADNLPSLQSSDCDFKCLADTSSVCGSKSSDSVAIYQLGSSSSSSPSSSSTNSGQAPHSSPTSTNASSSTQTGSSSNRTADSGMSASAIAAIVSCTILLIALVSGFAFLRRRRRLLQPSVSLLPPAPPSAKQMASCPQPRDVIAPPKSFDPSTSPLNHSSASTLLNAAPAAAAAAYSSSPPPAAPAAAILPQYARDLDAIVPGKTYFVRHGYAPDMDDELTLSAGDVVLIDEVFDDGWGSGTVVSAPTSLHHLSSPPSTSPSAIAAPLVSPSDSVVQDGVFPLACLVESPVQQQQFGQGGGGGGDDDVGMMYPSYPLAAPPCTGLGVTTPPGQPMLPALSSSQQSASYQVYADHQQQYWQPNSFEQQQQQYSAAPEPQRSVSVMSSYSTYSPGSLLIPVNERRSSRSFRSLERDQNTAS